MATKFTSTTKRQRVCELRSSDRGRQTSMNADETGTALSTGDDRASKSLLYADVSSKPRVMTATALAACYTALLKSPSLCPSVLFHHRKELDPDLKRALSVVGDYRLEVAIISIHQVAHFAPSSFLRLYL